MKLPAGDDLNALRDCSLRAPLLYHGLRRKELSKLPVQDIHLYRGVPHLRVHGKDGNVRHIRARARGLYRQVAGMARAHQHRDHASLRSAQESHSGLSDVQSSLLTGEHRDSVTADLDRADYMHV